MINVFYITLFTVIEQMDTSSTAVNANKSLHFIKSKMFIVCSYKYLIYLCQTLAIMSYQLSWLANYWCQLTVLRSSYVYIYSYNKTLWFTNIRCSSKAIWHTQIVHTQLIGWKHVVRSTCNGMCNNKNLPTLVL